jgi:2-desacetyl-2-hydroxyethyl bacteriochlorophyllide A dehydrogenase
MGASGRAIADAAVSRHAAAVDSAHEMLAVVVERPGAVALRHVPRPAPAPGETLVRVGAVGICGSDVEVLEGRRPMPYVRYPIIPGHEWAGTVEAVGPGVDNVEVGATVVAEGFRACGDCARCREGRTNLCATDYAETGFTHAGAFAEFLSVPAHLVHRLPPGTNPAAAAVLEPAACVAQGLLEVDLRPGLSVAVVGSGTLGLLAVALLCRVSPERLALVGTRVPRLELGLAMGATETWNVREEQRPEPGFDLVFEAAGTVDGARTAIGLARRGGTVVLEGISGQPGGVDADTVVLGHLRVQGVFGASRNAWRWVTQLFARGLLDTEPLVTHSFPLEEHAAAFAALTDRNGDALKVQLRPR